MLLLALAASAQSLAGKWSYSRAETDDDLSMAGIERLTIREDGAFDHTMDMDVVMVRKQEGDMLTLKPNKGSARNTPASIDAGSTASDRGGFVFMAAMPYLCTRFAERRLRGAEVRWGRG